MKIYYLGPMGSFSDLVVKKTFKQQNKFITTSTFEKIVENVINDDNSIGALVIENSISSSVHQNIDLIFNNKLYIVGETYMHIKLELIAMKGLLIDEITDVYSHPQALAQCSRVIKKYKWRIHETNSTSEAVDIIKKTDSKFKAAIGGSSLAEKYKLEVIRQNIGNENNNISRWIFISKSPIMQKKVNKLTYIFRVKHEPGSLVSVLKKIANKKGNLTKIESRPLPGTNWEYDFWIDVEIPENKQHHFHAIMHEETFDCRIVGEYSKGIKLI